MTITAGPTGHADATVATPPSGQLHEPTASVTMPAAAEAPDSAEPAEAPDSAEPAESSSSLRTTGQWFSVERLTAWRPPRLAGGAAALAGLALTSLGAFVDAALGTVPGPVFAVTFLLSCAIVSALVSRRSLATAVVLPPALFGGVTLCCLWAGGQDRGSRELLLDWATTLALWAPVIFAGTGIALAIVAGRWIAGLFRRTA